MGSCQIEINQLKEMMMTVRKFSKLLLFCTMAALLPALQVHAQQADNTLSKAEQQAGWKLLFDGKSTTGWRPYKNAASDGWEIVNGEIHCKEKNVQHRADMITKETYGDFELSF